MLFYFFFFFFSSRRRHTRCSRDWSSDVCSSDLTVSPAMHQHVVRLAERGMTGQRIIDQFVREHGVAILMAPPKRGFNLAGYFVPSVLIVAAGLVLTLVLRRWARTAAPDRGPAGPAAPAGTSEELERLRGELDRLSV